MTNVMMPSRRHLEAQVPEKYRNYAGIGPYYLPVFGAMYTRRLNQCLDATRRWVPYANRALDVGCGFGLATAALSGLYPEAEIIGLDTYTEEILRYASALMPRRSRARFVSGSIESAPFETGSFDLITAFDVLEHVGNAETALDEIARMLKIQGIAVVSVPIESPILQALRYCALVGGQRGNVHPHWEGKVQSLTEFEAAWRDRFETLEVFSAPFRYLPRLANYDIVLAGRPVNR